MAMAFMNQSSPAMLAGSMDVPHTQNTAPVLEFRCLYTSDLRRKQKRWQDGRLKFHTFNKRVMVYDEKSNFVGDTHWQRDCQFDEGEELQLERGGILVEVGECVGKRNQDLTELVEKRVKDRVERTAARNASSPAQPEPSLGPQTPSGSALMRPKSLNTVLGIPTGHYGKAIIPNQSPFEQRKLANRDEYERPAKRRKQDHTPVSKSGYAQALVGTKLTLASSRPSFSTSLRYEPSGASVERPTATIDLTGDNGPTRPYTTREQNTTAKIFQEKTYKPPARSGYASHLTGASLNLGKPNNIGVKRSLTGPGLNGKESHSIDDAGPSSAVADDSLAGDETPEAPQEMPTKRQQKRKGPVRQTKSSLPDPPKISYSSPPPIESHLTSLSQSNTKDEVAQNLCVRRSSDRPVSALRIKSRPRKMLMLMERPVSRSPIPTESLNDTQPEFKSLQAKLAPQDNILSQATRRLDSFRAQQAQRLQERLNGECPNLELEDFSSPPTDNGIDHQIIDKFVSRQSKQPKRGVPEESDETQQRSSPRIGEPAAAGDEAPQIPEKSQPRGVLDAGSTDGDHMNVPLKPSVPIFRNTGHASSETEDPSQPLPSVSRLPPNSTLPSIHTESINITSWPQPPEVFGIPKSHSPKTASQSTNTGIDAPNSMIHQSLENSTSGKITEIGIRDTVETAIPATQQSSFTPVHKSQQAYDVAAKKQLSSIPNSGLPHSVQASSELDPTLAINATKASIETPAIDTIKAIAHDGTSPPVPKETFVPDPEARPRPPSLPEHFTGAMQSATDHFRSIIKSSGSPPQQTVQDHNASEMPSSLAPANGADKSEPMSSDAAIKTSPRPSPLTPEGVDQEAQREEVRGSTITVGDNLGLTPLTVPHARPNQPRPKLLNPATRGPSIQATASKTANSLAPAFKVTTAMQPPVRTLARPGRNLVQAGSGDGRIIEAAPAGPWSRESFDLFGAWRPPSRDKSANIVNS